MLKNFTRPSWDELLDLIKFDRDFIEKILSKYLSFKDFRIRWEYVETQGSYFISDLIPYVIDEHITILNKTKKPEVLIAFIQKEFDEVKNSYNLSIWRDWVDEN